MPNTRLTCGMRPKLSEKEVVRIKLYKSHSKVFMRIEITCGNGDDAQV